MATHQTHQEKEAVYFVTFTCYRWLPLLAKSKAYDQIYRWFGYIQTDAQVIGYVIMPNHLHVLLYLNSEQKTLNELVAKGKRFIAYHVVNRLKAMKAHHLLQNMGQGISPSQKRKGQKHRVFRLSFDAKPCDS